MKDILRKAEELNEFASWFGLTQVSFDAERKQSDLGRLLHYLPDHATAVDEQQLVNYVYRPEDEMTPEAQRLVNIRRALQFCRVTEEAHGIPLLQKIHNILLNKLPEEDTAGRMRTAGDNPPHTMLRALQDDFTALANDISIHPLVRVWLLYYYLRNARFFETENDTLAIIFAYYFLQREGYGYRHLLKLEKYIIHSKKYMAYSINYFENKSFDHKINTDLSAFLLVCLQGFEQNLGFIEDKYQQAVKKRLEYGALKPRQKNAVNYWLEKGFNLNHSRLNALNARQRDILFRLYTQVEISNSEVAGLYNVDKKTVQDDLSVLFQMGIATLKGSGKEQKFILNFR